MPAASARAPKPAMPAVSGDQPEEIIGVKWMVLRLLWVAVELILAYWLAWQAQPFFYQRF